MKFVSESGPAAPFSTTSYSSSNTCSQLQGTPALYNVHVASQQELTILVLFFKKCDGGNYEFKYNPTEQEAFH